VGEVEGDELGGMLGGALWSKMGREKERRMVHKRAMVKRDGLVSLKALRKESMSGRGLL
jgi:hypothetical protein